MDRLVRAAAAMTSSSRDCLEGALEEVRVVSGSSPGPVHVQAWALVWGVCVCAPAPSLQALGWRPVSTPSSGYRAPNLQQPAETAPGLGSL